jgi:hypothetical protein
LGEFIALRVRTAKLYPGSGLKRGAKRVFIGPGWLHITCRINSFIRISDDAHALKFDATLTNATLKARVIRCPVWIPRHVRAQLAAFLSGKIPMYSPVHWKLKANNPLPLKSERIAAGSKEQSIRVMTQKQLWHE